MTRMLSDLIAPVPRYGRASNLERDRTLGFVADYHVVEPGLEMIRRLVSAAHTRSFIASGPYGSGKSSFALFLDALIGPRSDPSSVAARDRLTESDPAIASVFEQWLWAADPSGNGFIRAVATGRPEPVQQTAFRALVSGVDRHPGLPQSIRAKVDRLRAAPQSELAVADLYREVGSHAPIGLMIDELGVLLEAAADPGAGGLWLLQDLAEATSSPPRHGFLVGFQHQSLAEQIAGEREVPSAWRKIQGRFEELTFVESREALAALIPRVFRRTPDAWLDRAVANWATHCSMRLAELGLDRELPSAPTIINAGYPIHPTVSLVLPDLTSAYGQRERTLLAFLAGSEPNAVGAFLGERPATDPLPIVDLPQVYDFFVGTGNHRLGPAGRVSRWAEVERRIREAGTLDSLQARAIRAVAVLNLIGRGGPARASRGVLDFAVPGSAASLDQLVARGLLTYRSSSDEYRVWEGSELDLDAAVSTERTQVERVPLGELLAELAPLSPVIAAAHSERKGILRSFEQRFETDTKSLVVGRDGLIWYALDSAEPPRIEPAGRPVVVLHAVDREQLHELATEAGALTRLLASDDVVLDLVAEREIRERRGIAIDRLHGAIAESFAPNVASPTLLLDGSEQALPPALLSKLASQACDRAYGEAPAGQNEMFAVDELTSQGARARSLLLAAMIERPRAPNLGLSGWGPERAMYAALLANGGLHDHDAVVPFHPNPMSPYLAVWAELRDRMARATDASVTVGEVLASIEDRPFGLRRSLTPILWLAVMLAEPDQLAVFERGSFVPRLSSDVMDRLVKAPEQFAVRHFSARGARAGFVRAVDARMAHVGSAPATVVGVASRLVLAMRRLNPYEMRSTQVSERGRQVRLAITDTREPDVLLFEAIPKALGFDAIRPTSTSKDADEVAGKLDEALTELRSSFSGLRRRVRHTIAEAFDIADGPTLRSDLRVRSYPLLGHVTDRRARALLMAASEADLGDEEWLDAFVVACGLPPLGQWDDGVEHTFEATIRELGRLHRRLTVLYAEAWAQDLTGGFTARRVTVTAADGRESSHLVWLNDEDRPRLARLVDELVQMAEGLQSGTATEALMVLLTERLQAKDEHDEEATSRSA